MIISSFTTVALLLFSLSFAYVSHHICLVPAVAPPQYIIQNPQIDRLRSRPNENKITQNARSPIVPTGAPLLIIRKRNIVTTTFLVELPLELGCVICTCIVGTCNCFGRICESRGLSNLTPARSRLFKLIGKNGVMRWSCSRH